MTNRQTAQKIADDAMVASRSIVDDITAPAEYVYGAKQRLKTALESARRSSTNWADKAIEEIRSWWPNEVLNIDIQFNGYCYITRTLDQRVRAIAEGETLVAALTAARDAEKGRES